MARLTVEQVQAPNMSAAGNMLAQAGQSFDRGLTTASSVLGQYQKGQQSSGDAALTQAMLGLENEEQIGDFLAKNDLASMSLSPEMRKSALGLRDQLIGNAQGRANVQGTNATTGLTQANTRSVDGRLSLAQAAGGREASDHAYGNKRRDELSGVASNYAGALASGQQNGLSAYEGGGAKGGLLQEFEGLVTTPYNDPATDRNGNQIGPDIYRSGYGSNTYTTEDGKVHTVTAQNGGTEADARRDLNRRNTEEYNPVIAETIGQDMYANMSPQQLEVAQSLLHNYGKAAFKGVLAPVADAMRSGDAQAVASAIESMQGQNGGVNDRRRRAEASAFLSGDTGPAPQGQITQNGQMTPATQQLMAAVAQGSTFTMGDIDGMFAGINGAQDRGQAQIDNSEAERVRQSQAQSILDAANSPDVYNTTGVVSAATSNPNISAADNLAAASLAQESADGPLARIVSPSVVADPMLAAQGDSDARTRQNAIDALPQTALVETAERYGNDPVNGLIGDLGIGEDGEDPGTMLFEWLGENGDENLLRQNIRQIAEETGVTQAMAAAAMRDVFQRDPLFGNTNERRFDPEKVKDRINTTVGPEGMREYEDALVQNETRTGRNESAQLQVQTLERQLSKATDPRRREQLQAQVNQAKDQALQNATPQEAAQRLQDYIRKNGTASRLRAAGDPDSLEYGKAIEELRTEIERDDNLSGREKSLLISQLPG